MTESDYVAGKRDQAMDKAVQSKATYDKLFAEGGYEGVYDLPYRHSSYYPLYKRVMREVARSGAQSVLEVGCGSGSLAHLLMDRTSIRYRGFDFSDVAVQRAISRTGRAEAFYLGDATSPRSYIGQNPECIICTEVLEHIEQDLVAIESWLPGTFCVCSVPNFDADTHVRHFRSIGEVRARYGALIDITEIRRIRKPALSDISPRSFMRAVRWNRYHPRELARIIGIGSFDSMGGWFLFSGRRRR